MAQHRTGRSAVCAGPRRSRGPVAIGKIALLASVGSIGEKSDKTMIAEEETFASFYEE